MVDSGGMWNMFGEFIWVIDEKNRIVILFKLRDSLGSKFYIIIGFDDVIELRSEEIFMIFSNKLIV